MNLGDDGAAPEALAAALLISAPEANRRVRAADAVAERTSMLGETLAPLRPRLAAAQRDGDVSAEQVDVIERPSPRSPGVGSTQPTSRRVSRSSPTRPGTSPRKS